MRASFYALRHIAIGVWAAHGLSPWQIAALAGHAATRTRRRHYNGGASGWEQHAVPEPDSERVGWNGAPRRRTDTVL
jgi:integrase